MNPMLLGLGALPLAAEGEVVSVSNAYQQVISTVSGTLSEANLKDVLVYAVGAAIVLVFFWWAVRKCAGIIKKAFMRGKLRL